MPVSAVDIAAALRTMRHADQHERLEQLEADRERVWWRNGDTYVLSTVTLDLADLASFERGEVPPGLPLNTAYGADNPPTTSSSSAKATRPHRLAPRPSTVAPTRRGGKQD